MSAVRSILKASPIILLGCGWIESDVTQGPTWTLVEPDAIEGCAPTQYQLVGGSDTELDVTLTLDGQAWTTTVTSATADDGRNQVIVAFDLAPDVAAYGVGVLDVGDTRFSLTNLNVAFPSGHVDADGDGFGMGDPLDSPRCDLVDNADDCDDSNPAISPDASEQPYNVIDENCDGMVDCFVDEDGDLFFAPGLISLADATAAACSVPLLVDCDDLEATIYPGAEDRCGDVDTDCDGQDDVGDLDSDGDTYTVCQGDCDDGNGAVRPGLEEACDGQDTDCDPLTLFHDEEEDADGDGYLRCETPDLGPRDCDDDVVAIYPGAEELCDGLDNDCDGIVQEDRDLDGFVNQGYDPAECSGELAAAMFDCNDDNEMFTVASVEVCDGIRNDCLDLPADQGVPAFMLKQGEDVQTFGQFTTAWNQAATDNGEPQEIHICENVLSDDDLQENVHARTNPQPLTLIGHATDALDVPRIERTFHITTGALTLENLVLTGGPGVLAHQDDEATSGGGVFGTGGLLTLNDVSVECHPASPYAAGGGIYWSGSDDDTVDALVMNGGTIRGCEAIDGGAIRIAGGTVDLHGVQLDSNHAERGGAIYVDGEVVLNVGSLAGPKQDIPTVMRNNTATTGAGLYADPEGTAEFQDVQFVSNSGVDSVVQIVQPVSGSGWLMTDNLTDSALVALNAASSDASLVLMAPTSTFVSADPVFSLTADSEGEFSAILDCGDCDFTQTRLDQVLGYPGDFTLATSLVCTYDGAGLLCL